MNLAEPEYAHVSPAQVAARLGSGVPLRLVDVREPWEYERRHIPQILLMPMSEFAERGTEELAATEEIVLICEHGVRSENAARYLAAQGYTHVATMTGGMASYEGPVEQGR